MRTSTAGPYSWLPLAPEVGETAGVADQSVEASSALSPRVLGQSQSTNYMVVIQSRDEAGRWGTLHEMTALDINHVEVTRSSEAALAEVGDVGAEASGAFRLCVIVPALNEGRTVAKVVGSIRDALPAAHIIVIDDGSTDDTSARALKAGAVVITLPLNLGIGGAVQTGYLYAERHGFDIAMQIDGDGQHDPGEARLLIDPIVERRADLVVGSRWLGRGDYKAPYGRRLGMRILSGLVRSRTGQSITDTTSGFRAVGRLGVELFAHSYSSDFPEVEALVMARQCGLRIEEVPVQMEQRLHGRSSIAGLRSCYYMLRVVVALVVDVLNRKEQP